MKPFGLGILTGILVGTIAASLVFALTDQDSAATTSRSAPATLVDVENYHNG
ncbi:hypothetical protein [Nonomuraea jiangxiensis]|uniref:DUF2613 domain-containing protein n=1 Tax=Nonomuraea jiangxiensis TaxID=633440 RepID=A0A1G8LEM1_9ACTN|nr:hypothetical protein [Nonomuraea jiangxiensis]SDI54144.1 hypothetical protein SAMN05421869_10672 [Nonomuraea jiangxiensis]